MSFFTQILAPVERRSDGLLADKPLPKPIPPTWGPYADPPRQMPPYTFDEHQPIDGPVGWTYFLSEPTQIQNPVHPQTYSLHKPDAWKPQKYGLEECVSQLTEEERDALLARNWPRVKDVYAQCLDVVHEEIGWPKDDNYFEFDKRISRLMAAHYGIEMRG